ncbi:MAG TPA: PKD domain-containing protein [Gammaproteobacteria bacterium]
MSERNSITRTPSLCAVLAASMVLVACDSSDVPREFRVPEVTINPSEESGVVPFSVVFDVEASHVELFGGTWDFGDGNGTQSQGASAVAHTYTTPGEYEISAVFTADSVTIRTTVYTTMVFAFENDGQGGPIGGDPEDPDVNLVVSSFAIDREVTPGTPETISAIIQNLGPDILTGSGHFDVGYYLSTDDVITVDDIYLGDTSIALGDAFLEGDVAFGFEQLGPLENYQFDHVLSVRGNIAPGTYYAGAIVDYLDEYHWYDFPRATDTLELEFPVHVTVPETDETDNIRVLTSHQVVVNAPACAEDAFEPDNGTTEATPLAPGVTQAHNFCRDNSDWYSFNAVAGNVYAIKTSSLGAEADTQLILYDTDGESILLFHDNIINVPLITNCGEIYTYDLECGPTLFEALPSEIVWEAQVSGTYYIKARATTCDEDKDLHCAESPDGPGITTEYNITLE